MSRAEKRQRKIAILSLPLVPQLGGAVEATVRISENLLRLNWDVKNFSLGYSHDEISNPPNLKISKYKGKKINEKALVSFSEFRSCWRDLTSFDPDLIFVQQLFNLAVVVGYFYAISNRKPLVVCPHGSLNLLNLKEDNVIAALLKRTLTKALYRKSLKFLITSPFEFERIEKKFQNKCVMVNMGVEIPDLKEFVTAKSKGVVYLGRIDRIKRLEIILVALDILNKRGQKVEFSIYGSGDLGYQNELHELSRKLNLLDQVAFYPWVLPNHRSKVFCEYKIVVLSSESESFGLSMMEGVACGLIGVIGDHLPNSQFLSENKLGISVSEQTPKGYADGIALALKLDNGLTIRQVQEKLSRTYDWRNVFANWSAVLASAIDNKH